MINDIHIDNNKDSDFPFSGGVIFQKQSNGLLGLTSLNDWVGDKYAGKALNQNIKTTARSWQGEWILEKRFGVPVFAQLGQPFSFSFAKALQKAISQKASVKMVQVLTNNIKESGFLTVQIIVVTINGNTFTTRLKVKAYENTG